jgi:flagellar basal body-associated protein FliL
METHHDEVKEARESGRIALVGFGAALVWLAVVSAIAFMWASKGA